MRQLKMVWKSEDYSGCDFELPDGFHITFLHIEDVDKWCALCTPLTGEKWTNTQFQKNMIKSPLFSLNYERIFCIYETKTNRLVSTASACFNPVDKTGNLHMVMTDNEYRGKGLGKTVCIEALNCFYSNNIEQVTLFTDDDRIPAIKMYLKLGFMPCLYYYDMYSRWMNITHQINPDFNVFAFDYNNNKVCINHFTDISESNCKLYKEGFFKRISIWYYFISKRIKRKLSRMFRTL